jgi:hypothetical protein
MLHYLIINLFNLWIRGCLDFFCTDMFQKSEGEASQQGDATSASWEKVRTTKIRTSKTKKNSENHANHHNVEKNY